MTVKFTCQNNEFNVQLLSMQECHLPIYDHQWRRTILFSPFTDKEQQKKQTESRILAPSSSNAPLLKVQVRYQHFDMFSCSSHLPTYRHECDTNIFESLSLELPQQQPNMKKWNRKILPYHKHFMNWKITPFNSQDYKWIFIFNLEVLLTFQKITFNSWKQKILNTDVSETKTLSLI
jgi:hypothetical protein